MSNSENIISGDVKTCDLSIVLIFILTCLVLFVGSPDLHDAIIHHVMNN